MWTQRAWWQRYPQNAYSRNAQKRPCVMRVRYEPERASLLPYAYDTEQATPLSGGAASFTPLCLSTLCQSAPCALGLTHNAEHSRRQNRACQRRALRVTAAGASALSTTTGTIMGLRRRRLATH